MRFRALCVMLTPVLSLGLLSGVVGAQKPVGIFDAQSDVGRLRRPGSTTHDPQRQTYLVAGSGQNMWNDRDDFHFVWKRMTGNFILSTRARFIGRESTDIGRSAGRFGRRWKPAALT